MSSFRRVEFIKYLLSRLRSIWLGDAVQSSGKLYEDAEECVKALSERFSLPEVKDAEERGWTVIMLERAVRRLSDKFGMDVQPGWDAVNHLHVYGFHEVGLEVNDVKARIP